MGDERWSGRVVRGYLGVGLISPTTSVAAAAGVPITSGILVVQVSPGTPAAQAGLRQGDVIAGIGGMTVRDQGDLQAALTNRFKPGAQVGLQINRDGNEQTVPVTLAERPTP